MINTKDSGDIRALKTIWKMGGKAYMRSLARAMGITSEYARVILFDIGKKDYIDITGDGMCVITEKGKELLKSRGILAQIKAKIKEEEEKGKPKIISLKY